MTGRAFVLVGPNVRLDRAGLSAPAPETVEGLLRQCHGWAAELGWTLAERPTEADGIVVGPGITPPPIDVPVAVVERGQGSEGFRWALRHLAFSTAWPATTLRYGPGPDHVGDLRRPPAGADPPVAVLLHGGFWSAPWRRDLMDGLAVDLARRGWLTWNVEYRRLGTGGGWPATGNDALAAVDAAGKIDGAGQPVTLIGHSAGAQLALWAAAERRERVARVVSLAGLCDLDLAGRQRVGGTAVEQLLSGEPPSVASPIDRLPLGVPAIVAHVTSDAVVPAEQSRRYADAAARAGDTVELMEVAAGDHMSLIDPASAWRAVAERLPAPPS